LWLPRSSNVGADASAVSIARADHPLLRGVDFSDVRVLPSDRDATALSVLATAAGRLTIERALGRIL